jgi:hypothetical protein
MDKRGTQRLRTFKGGSIMFGLAAAIDCTIRNLSDAGAALEVQNPVAVPDEFALLIKPEFLKRNCRVAWRSANRIGVQFVGNQGRDRARGAESTPAAIAVASDCRLRLTIRV